MNDFITKKTLIVCALVVGIGMALALGGVIYIALKINDVQQTEIADNRDRLDHQKQVNKNLRKAVTALDAITHPTPEQYRRQLKEGLRRCLREPTCRRLFPKLTRTGISGARSNGSAHRAHTHRRPKSSRTTTPSQTPTSRPTRPTRPKRRQPHNPPGGGGSSPSPPPAPQPSRPPPLVEVHPPVQTPLHICLDPFAEIGC